MKRIVIFLYGVVLFYTTLWLPMAALVVSPSWYEVGCRWHGRCVLLDEGQAPRAISELTSFFLHKKELADPGWTLKEKQHLKEARLRMDIATLLAALGLIFLFWMGKKSVVRKGAIFSFSLLLAVGALLPFFAYFWRHIFHPTLFSNRLWLNTPADLSFYLMPRSFFFWTVVAGLGVSFCLNFLVWFLAGCILRDEVQEETLKQGGIMKKVALVSLGLILGILASQGYRWWRSSGETRRLETFETQQVVSKKYERNKSHKIGLLGYKEGETLSKREKRFSPDLEAMRKALPGNQAIPAVDENEKWIRKEADKARRELYGRISSNVATDEEVNAYYYEQETLAQDSIAMLKWILDNHSHEMGKDDLARHTFLLEQFKKRLKAIPVRKERAMTRIRKHRSKSQG